MSTGTTGPSAPSTPSNTPNTSSPPLLPLPGPVTSASSTTSSTSSSSSTASASSSSSASDTSSSGSSSTTSSTTSSTSSTTSSTTTPTRTPTRTTTSTGIPAVITEVSTTIVSATESNSPSAGAVKSTSSSFFSNKAAVAGVFTVVGLIGLVILIALLTNAIRRRRAKKFDKELFAATREAAATAPNPNFLDDDDDSEDRLKHSGYGPGYGGGGGNSYSGKTYSSEGSHGQYGQPPMEAFNMRDMMSHSVPVGEIYDPYAAGGAAGIGVVRARSANAKTNLSNPLPNPYAAALQEGGSPYPKFAIGPQNTYNGGAPGMPFGRSYNGTSTDFDAPRGQPQQPYHQQPYPQQSPSPQEYANLGRSKSDSTAATHVSTPSLTHSQSHSQQPQYPARQVSPPQMAPARIPSPQAQVFSSHKTEPSGGSGGSGGDNDAYGGYALDDADEVEEEAPRRVLKIANES